MPGRKTKKRVKPFGELLQVAVTRLRPPFGVVLGSPIEAAELVQHLPEGDTVCYQMDLHQADRLRDELSRHPRSAAVAAHADLWDLPAACGLALAADDPSAK